MQQVIVLNNDYNFLSTTSWKRAIKLIIKGKAEILYSSSDSEIRAEGEAFPRPLIVKLLRFVRTLSERDVPVPFSKKRVFIRDRYVCQYCGKNCKNDPTLDHILPRAMGGKTNWKNTVTSCIDCNRIKGSKTPKQAKMQLNKKPHVPTSWELHVKSSEKMKQSKMVSEVLDDFMFLFQQAR